MLKSRMLASTILLFGTLPYGDLIAAVTVDPGANPPAGFQPYDGAANVDPDGLTLSWEPVADAKSYSVYFGDDPDELTPMSSVTEPRLVLATPLARGRGYCWRVDTRTTAGATVPSPVMRFTTVCASIGDPTLVAWYGFDEAAGSISHDLSGNGFDAQLTQMVWETTGAPGLDGGSVRSDGSGDVRFGIPKSARPLDELTLTGWFRIPQQAEPAALWALGDGTASYVSLVPQPAGGGGLVIRVRSIIAGLPIDTQAGDPLPLDHWTHLAVVIDAAADQVTVYEDGAVVLTAQGLMPLGGILESATTVLLGMSFTSNVRLECSMDDVRLYARALTADEVARTMLGCPNSPFAPLPRHNEQIHTSVPAVLRWEAENAVSYNVYAGAGVGDLALVGRDLLQPQCALAKKFTNGQVLCWQVEAAVEGGYVRSPLWQLSVTSRSLADIIKNTGSWWPDYMEYYRQIAPDISLTDTAGRGHRLRDYRGQHLLVVLWAPWCSVCRNEMTTLSRLRTDMSEQELGLLAITDESNRSTTSAFLDAHPEINFPVGLTRVTALPGPFGDTFHYPSIFYIAPDGMIKLATIGEMSIETMKQIINAAWPYEP